jgi:acetyl esterase/lipase
MAWVIALSAAVGVAFAEASPDTAPQTSKVEMISLWPGVAPGSGGAPSQEELYASDRGRVVMAVAHPDLWAFYAAKPNGAAIMVIPGGGYRMIYIDYFGFEIARWLNTLGIDAFVLKYRLPNEGHEHGPDVPVQDAQRALRLIRANAIAKAAGHMIDPARIGVMGFSSGGNLAAILGTYIDKKVYEPVDEADALSSRPNFMVLVYAYIPRPDEFALHSADKVTQLLVSYPIESRVTDQTPPAFVIAGDRDNDVPYAHSERIERALHRVGVPVELHIFHGAPHAFGLHGNGREKVWPALCAAWLERQGVIPLAPN